MKTTIQYGDTVTGEQIAALGDVALDGDKATVGGYSFHVSPHSQEWICDRVPPNAAQREAAKVADAARSMPWHTFVCWYVARKTARKAYKGHSVRKSVNGYAIFFAGVADVDRDASTVYGWFERCPLLPLSREADAARIEALS